MFKKMTKKRVSKTGVSYLNYLSDLVLSYHTSKGNYLTNLKLQKELIKLYNQYLEDTGKGLFNTKYIIETRYGKLVKPIYDKYKSKYSVGENITLYKGVYIPNNTEDLVKLLTKEDKTKRIIR